MSEFLTRSRAESHRLGFEIFRSCGVTVDQLPLFFAECAEKRPDVVILRTGAAEAHELLPQLSTACHTIVADSLLEFRKTLHEGNIADALGSGAGIFEGAEYDTPRIAELVRRCYADYTNHYHANPCLDRGRILEGLVEFSLGFMTGAARTLFVAELNGRLVGYLCMEIRDGVGSTVIGGSALDIPVALRHKVLCDLTHRGDLWLMEHGVRRFVAVTRTDKTYIQKLLCHNMHTLPSRTLVTLHLNLFLHAAAGQPEQQTGEWPPAMITGINAATLTRCEVRPALSAGFEQSVLFSLGERSYVYSVLTDAAGIYAFTALAFQLKTSTTGLIGGGVSPR
ncbi:MAG: hypothetical protein OHK0011_14790 [Turneriella sp.]